MFCIWQSVILLWFLQQWQSHLLRMTRKCMVHGRTTKAVSVLTASTVRSATISGFRGGNSLGNLRGDFMNYRALEFHLGLVYQQQQLITSLSCPGTSLCPCGREALCYSPLQGSPAGLASGFPWRRKKRPWTCSSRWLQGWRTGREWS